MSKISERKSNEAYPKYIHDNIVIIMLKSETFCDKTHNIDEF